MAGGWRSSQSPGPGPTASPTTSREGEEDETSPVSVLPFCTTPQGVPRFDSGPAQVTQRQKLRRKEGTALPELQMGHGVMGEGRDGVLGDHIIHPLPLRLEPLVSKRPPCWGPSWVFLAGLMPPTLDVWQRVVSGRLSVTPLDSVLTAMASLCPVPTPARPPGPTWTSPYLLWGGVSEPGQHP